MRPSALRAFQLLLFCGLLIPVGHSTSARAAQGAIDETTTAEDFVSDYAALLTRSQRAELVELLRQHNQRGLGSIYVCIIEELPTETSASKFAAQFAARKPLGWFERDDRVVLLVMLAEARCWIRTNPNVNAALTHDECGTICEEVIGPRFAQRRPYLGIREGVQQIAFQLASGSQWLKLSWLAAAFTNGRLIALKLLSIGLALVLLVVLHEFSHALLARLMGLRVFCVSIGYGRRIFATSLGDVRIELHAFPFGGRTLLGIPPGSASAWPLCLSIFAGPGFHILLALFLYLAGESGLLLASHYTVRAPFFAAFLSDLSFINWIDIFVNLCPLKITEERGTSLSDGYQLWQLLTHREEMVNKYRLAYFVHLGERHKHADQPDLALTAYEKGLESFPQHPTLLLFHADAWLHLGEYEQARNGFIEALNVNNDAERDLRHPVLLNNIAYADALLCREELYDEADKYSIEVRNRLAYEPVVCGTRGVVLLRLGRVAEGIRLLKQAHFLHSDPRRRADEACWIAIGEALRGNFAEARKWLQAAREGRARPYLLRQVAREIEALTLHQTLPATGLASVGPLEKALS